jgi:hypothetical protein
VLEGAGGDEPYVPVCAFWLIVCGHTMYAGRPVFVCVCLSHCVPVCLCLCALLICRCCACVPVTDILRKVCRRYQLNPTNEALWALPACVRVVPDTALAPAPAPAPWARLALVPSYAGTHTASLHN